jgi:clorobiocin biosynthesis protein CloN4
VSADLLHDLVRDSGVRVPDAPAVHAGDTTISYKDLDSLCDRLAWALYAEGVRNGDRVVIWAGKSITVVALMQAALRLGAIYVPVAPGNPVSRVRRIVADCAPALVVVDDDRLSEAAGAGWDAHSVGAGHLDDAAADTLRRAAPSGDEGVEAGSPAYILYTSGSTGDPKGVLISHRNALAFVRWAAAETGLTSRDRLSNHAAFNFDLSVFDLYGAFLSGASVDLIPAELAYAPNALAEYLHGRGITVWYSVPSALLLMMRYGGLLEAPAPSALRVCVFAGEPFPVREARDLRVAWPGVRLFNWYGPTETNVCTSYEVTDADLEAGGAMPIGAACSGDVVALDPPGADEGEIVVHGPTVMLGYWGRDRHLGGYRTGDIARLRPDGELEYVGRRDSLVKVRGHRVELGEIEAVLASHPDVVEVAVVIVGTGIDTRLRAVVVPGPGAAPGLLSLKSHCAARLPRYMIIDEISVRDSMPRNGNGKTDRRVLAAAL